jgi:hypothetical protein
VFFINPFGPAANTPPAPRVEQMGFILDALQHLFQRRQL